MTLNETVRVGSPFFPISLIMPHSGNDLILNII